VLPKPFDGIEVRAVSGEIGRLDVVPDQGRALVPAGVVQNQMHLLAFCRRNFLGHYIEESLEDFRVAMTDDQAHELAAGGLHRSHHIAPQMPSVVSLGRTTASLDPLVARARIAFEARLIAEEYAG
jgi:hypothetical protein